MNSKLNIGFLTTVSGRWPRELPNKRNIEYLAWLKENLEGVNITAPETIVDSPEKIENAIKLFKAEDVDVVVLIYGAFTGDDVGCAIGQRLNVPILFWAPNEPEVNGGRLLSNALVALTMNCASMHRLNLACYPVYGGLNDKTSCKRVLNYLKAYLAVKALKNGCIGMFGYRPTAFYNSTFDEGLIRRTFGSRIEETDLKVVFDLMESLPQNDVDNEIKNVKSSYNISEDLSEEYIENHARLYIAMKQLMQEQNYKSATLKCWPEMGNLKATPCAVIGRFCDENIPVACESDMDALLAAIAENALTSQAPFITDMIDINKAANYLTFWHCGNAAPSLHNKDYPTELNDHPLAGQGTAFYTTLKKGYVTIARFCNIHGKYKLALIRGEAIKTDLYTPGCMINVKTKNNVEDIAYNLIKEGIPHHYSIVWEDIADILIQTAEILGIEVLEF